MHLNHWIGRMRYTCTCCMVIIFGFQCPLRGSTITSPSPYQIRIFHVWIYCQSNVAPVEMWINALSSYCEPIFRLSTDTSLWCHWVQALATRNTSPPGCLNGILHPLGVSTEYFTPWVSTTLPVLIRRGNAVVAVRACAGFTTIMSLQWLWTSHPGGITQGVCTHPISSNSTFESQSCWKDLIGSYGWVWWLEVTG